MSEVGELLDVARRAAEAAGAVLSAHRGAHLEVETKRGALDLVTDVDRRAEQAVLDVLSREVPGDAVLAEESGAAGSGERTWIIDPLDGTTNFIHDLPHFAVSVAVYRGDVGLAGVILDPVRGETFLGAAGEGAWIERGAARRALRVRSPADLGHALLATGFAYRELGEAVNVREFVAVLPRVRGIRRCGAATLDLAYVAAGRLDGFWEYRLAPWDVAAGAILVREAGGQVDTIPGGGFSPHAPSILAAAPAIAPALRSLLVGA